MGVDYSAKFGIGIEVEPSYVTHLIDEECYNDEESIEDLDDMEIMECLKLPDGITTSYWGNSYSGHHTHFIHAEGNAQSKEEMMKQWDLMEAWVKEVGLEGSVGLIGGGLVW